MHDCNFTNIGSYDFYAASCSDPDNIIVAENNFWEATDSTIIADAHIFDHYDDETAPTVDFMPFLMEAASGAIIGTVVDEDNNPIPDVETRVSGSLEGDITDTGGEYILNGLEINYYNISFSHPDYRDTVISEIFVSIGDTVILNLTMQVPCPYILGDFNGNEIVNLSDLIAAFSRLSTGSPEPALTCECPAGSEEWAVAMDVNNNCEFNISDVVIMFSMLSTGSPDLVPCEFCPPPGWEPSP